MTNRRGNPLAELTTAADVHETTVLEELIDALGRAADRLLLSTHRYRLLAGTAFRPGDDLNPHGLYELRRQPGYTGTRRYLEAQEHSKQQIDLGSGIASGQFTPCPCAPEGGQCGGTEPLRIAACLLDDPLVRSLEFDPGVDHQAPG